jgi:Ca2+-binding EF-hand superfamily protein
LRVQLLLASVVLLSACGADGQLSTVRPASADAELQARSTAGLLAGFDRVHKAIFDKQDSDGDGQLTEYEVGPMFALDRFASIDFNMDGSIAYREFVAAATDRGFPAWWPGGPRRDDAERFAGRFRTYLADRFVRLDASRDGFLVDRELSNADLTRVSVGLEYPELNLKPVRVRAVPTGAVKAADKTGDGRLSPGEFEDLFMDLIVAELAK